MGLRINTNIAAMNAYRNLSVTSNQMSDSLAKLSSGYRINKAADDAAGLAISEGLRSQIGGLQVAARNTQDGINVVQTADGALNESTSILQRMRDLSVQAANDGGLSTEAKSDIKTEMDQLGSELTRIAGTTTFNNKHLLDGSYTGTFQVGANAGETITVQNVGDMSATGLGVNGLDVTTAAQAGWVANLKQVSQTAAAGFSSASVTAWVGGTGASLTVNGKAVDLTGVTDGATLATAINKAGTGVTATWDATNGMTLASAQDITVATTDDGTNTAPAFTAAADATQAQLTANDALASGADKAIKAIDGAITNVSTTRANLGAYQNRFEHTINNINVAVENLSASESSIRDTDMASEMVNFTRTQILSQAGTAMLAQANQIPQGVLKLLG